MKQRHPHVQWLFIIAIAGILISCAQADGTPRITAEGTYEVDPLFRQFYESLGGLEIMGPAISPVFEKDGVIYQYLDRGLMQYEPTLPKGERLKLAPLGRELGVYELPTAASAVPGAIIVEGYPVDAKFYQLIKKLGGIKVVGKPLTGVHQNLEAKRYEQYFENLGFFWKEDDPLHPVGLLSYGAWKCNVYCRHSPPQQSRISLPTRTTVPFLKEVARLGLEFTGYARTEPFLAPDGTLQQIYDNVVMLVNPEDPDTVRLLPLPEKMGLSGDTLQPPTSDPQLYFYPVQGGLGYNIPAYFVEYLQQHGGIERLGAPVSQLSQQDGRTYRQCFRSVCLEATLDDAGNVQVAPVALGLKYRDLFFRADQATVDESRVLNITLQVWEDLPLVSPDQQQSIGVVVYGNNLPLAGVEPELALTMPDGSLSNKVMPATNDQGESSITLEPLQVKNGTLIPYKVCVNSSADQKFCVLDSFLVWITDYVTLTPLAPVQYNSYLPFVFKHIQIYAPLLIEEFMTYIPLVNNGR